MRRGSRKMLRSRINTTLDRIEHWHNWASDTRAVWFPFEFLRIPKDTLLSFPRRLAMTFCFGTLTWVLLLLRIWNSSVDLGELLGLALKVYLVFFAWFNGVTAYFWNRRARRLNSNLK